MSLQMLKAHPFRVMCALFILFACVWFLIVRNLGFIGDDWRSLLPAYRADWPRSLFVFLVDGKRVFQSVHVLTAFEAFALHAPVYMAMTLVLHVIGTLTMGQSLKIAFPQFPRYAAVATIFAFLMPPLTALLFRLTYDGGRISVMFFWVALICYQRWSQGRSWIYIVSGTILWMAALLTYENILLGPVVIILLCLPILLTLTPKLSYQQVAKRLVMVILGCLVGYGLMFLIRQLIGIPFHSQFSGFPEFNVKTTFSMGIRLIIPPLPISFSPLFFGVASILAVCIGSLLWIWKPATTVTPKWMVVGYWIGAGGVIFVVGLIPYMGADFRITTLSLEDSMIRSLSFSAYGMAMMGAAGITWLMMYQPPVRAGAVFVMVIWITFSAMVWLEMGDTERLRELTRQRVYTEWFTAIPDVTPNTVVVLLDFPTDGFRDAIRRDGIVFHNAIKILYDDPTVDVVSLVTAAQGTVIDKGALSSGKFAIITPEGLQPRAVTGFIPLDRLVILQYRDGNFVIRDRITPEDNIEALWEGQDELVSNTDRIVTTNRNLDRLYQIGFLQPAP